MTPKPELLDAVEHPVYMCPQILSLLNGAKRRAVSEPQVKQFSERTLDA